MCILRNDAVLRHGYIITSSSNDVTTSFLETLPENKLATMPKL